MRPILFAVAALSLTFAPAAFGKPAQCRDVKGHFTACPAAAPASPAPAKGDACRDNNGHFAKCSAVASNAPTTSGGSMGGRSMPSMSGGHPVCKIGKPCGNSCISKEKVCHK